MKYIFRLFATFFILLFASHIALAKGEVINQVVAVVNDGVVTQTDLNTALARTKAQAKMAGVQLPPESVFKHKVLDQLIVEKIALQLAKVNNLTVTDSEIQKAVEEVAKRNGTSVADLKKMVKSQGLSYDQYKRVLKKKLLIRKLEQSAVASSIVITPQDVSNYLKQMKSTGKVQPKYTLSHILIGTGANPTPASIRAAEKKADKILALIKGNMPFTKAVAEYSDAGDALQGGLIKNETVSELPSLFAQAVTSMKIGQIKGPIKSQNGYHIIKLISKKEPKAQTHYIDEYHIKMIMVKTSPILSSGKARTLLLSLRNAIENGASFASVAKLNSQDVASAANGGDLGWVTPEKMPAGLAEEVAAMPLNHLSKPFSIGNKWYLVQVLAKRQKDDTQGYKEMIARRALFQQKAVKAVQAWQAKIRAESYVKVLIN